VLLAQQPGFQVVGEASHGKELLAQACDTAPDLALVDWELPGLPEIGGPGVLRKVLPRVHVVALSSRIGARREALAAGVDAFVSKGDPPERLLAVLRRCSKAVQ
jgi:two-component system response regulator DesR